MPEKTIETLEHDLKTEHALYLRALADFDNYRRRMDRERGELGQEAVREFMAGLLDVIDDLERFLESVGEEASQFIDGVRVVRQKLLALLERQGAHPFQSVGEPFDPKLHEVAATVPSSDKAPLGTVVRELRRGYKFRDDLLRPARVVVAA